MRPSEDFLDPDVLAELEAIDTTLAGEPVDPTHAELAELALLLVAERPRLSPQGARALDDRVPWRVAPETTSTRTPWWRRPQWGVALTGVAALAVVIGLVTVPSGGGSLKSGSINGSGSSSTGSGVAASSGPALGAPRRTSSGHQRALPLTPALKSNAQSKQGLLLDSSSSSGSSSAASASSATGSPTLGAPQSGALTPAPVPSARKTIQSAQLQLSTPGKWIDVVSQEVFDVVGQEKGIVRNSQVTSGAGSNGYANFTLSIPSANLTNTLSRLSAVAHARVVSRTDGTQDVNGQYLSDQRRLADARALRTSLLKQLAAATTQTQIDSLKAQIHDAEASIASDESTLRGLENQISFSQLVLNVNATPIPVDVAPSTSAGGGFTLGRAAHDAVRVLTVAAGVALITLAALVPLALLVALGLWIAFWVRRRRREQALDAA